MKKEVLQFIKTNNLINAGEVVGVAVSGGVDSMVLLHFLNSVSKQLDFNVHAITIDHHIRKNSFKDNQLVMQYCSQNNIKVNCFNVDAVSYAKQHKQSLETAARNVRYGVFDSLIAKNIVNKIALAHHLDDQAETILMNLFRGAGNKGVGGMEPQRDGYIRPFLNTSKAEIKKWAQANNLPVAEDSTNQDDAHSRNFLRNQIMPLIESRWEGAAKNIASFGEINRQDNQYFAKNLNTHGVIYLNQTAKVPTSYFLSHPSIYTRQFFAVLSQIGCSKDIEKKHIQIVREFALSAQTGKKLKLPNNLIVSKEYDFIVLLNKQNKSPQKLNQGFKVGKISAGEFGEIEVKKVKKFEASQPSNLFLDGDKLPAQAVWRLPAPTDKFTKFGGGTKSLKAFLVNKKVPATKRKILPVLAYENFVYAIAGIEISEAVKVDGQTKNIYKISVKQAKPN